MSSDHQSRFAFSNLTKLCCVRQRPSTLLSTPGTFLPGWPSLLHLITQGKTLQLFRVTSSTAKMKKIHLLGWLKGWNLN